MKITRRQLRQIIKETVSIPVPGANTVYVILEAIDSASERVRGVLKAGSHEDLSYTEKSIGTGPERVDRALHKELGNLKRLVGALETKLSKLGLGDAQ